jgi:hypothetical protein
MVHERNPKPVVVVLARIAGCLCCDRKSRRQECRAKKRKRPDHMAVQGTSVFEDGFAARPLFGGAIRCCIPANFHVGFHVPSSSTAISSYFCLCFFLHLFGFYGLLEFCLCLAQLSMDFVFHLVFSLFLVSNVQYTIFFPLCDCHELLSRQSCVRDVRIW